MKPTQPSAAGEGEVLDVDVANVGGGELDRVARQLQGGDAVSWVEADAKRRRVDCRHDMDEVADRDLLIGFERERHRGRLVGRDRLAE